MELGDIEGVDIQIAAASKLAEALHRPIWLWWTSLFRGARARSPAFDEAERLAQETLAIGQRGQAENALHYYAQTMFNIRREQGRLAEVEGAVRGFIELYPAIPAWRGALALLLVELGRPDEARAEFEQVAAGRVRRLPARRQLADRDHADGRGLRRAGRCGARRGAYRLLEPYAGRNVVVGRNATCYGSASRLLGVLAAARGEAGSPSTTRRGAAMHAAMGARPGTPARRSPTPRCCSRGARGRRRAGDGDARRRGPRRGRPGHGRARRARPAPRAHARRPGVIRYGSWYISRSRVILLPPTSFLWRIGPPPFALPRAAP